MPPTGCSSENGLKLKLCATRPASANGAKLEDAVVPRWSLSQTRVRISTFITKQVVVDEAAGAVAAQSFLIGQQALVAAQPRLRPEWNFAVDRLVFVKYVTGKRDALSDGVVLAALIRQSGVRNRAAGSDDPPIRNMRGHERARIAGYPPSRASRIASIHLRQNFAAPR